MTKAKYYEVLLYIPHIIVTLISQDTAIIFDTTPLAGSNHWVHARGSSLRWMAKLLSSRDVRISLPVWLWASLSGVYMKVFFICKNRTGPNTRFYTDSYHSWKVGQTCCYLLEGWTNKPVACLLPLIAVPPFTLSCLWICMEERLLSAAFSLL